MTKKNDNMTFETIVTNLKEALHSIGADDNQKVCVAIECLDDKIAMHKKAKKGLANFFSILIVVFVASLIGISLLFDRINALESQIENLKYRDSLFVQFMEPDSASTITYRVKNGIPVTYQQLVSEKDSLEQKYYDLESLKEHYRIQLGLIVRNYPITIEQRNNIYSVHALKIDSALHLLDVYRDMIKFDPQKKEWTVTRYYNK